MTGNGKTITPITESYIEHLENEAWGWIDEDRNDIMAEIRKELEGDG
jgi:hypothetical protein